MSMIIKPPPSTFALGQCAISKAVQDAVGIPESYALIARHGQRDWGDAPDSDKLLNQRALDGEDRAIVSHYQLDVTVQVVTAKDHSVTVAKLLDEKGFFA